MTKKKTRSKEREKKVVREREGMNKKWPEVRDGYKLQLTEVKYRTTAP